MSSSNEGQGASITSNLTELILIANAGNSSFVVQNDSVPTLFIDSNSNVGINTLTPSSKLEVVSDSDSSLCLRRGKTSNLTANMFVTSSGDLAINPSQSNNKITTTGSLDLLNHNGSTTGLKLGGALVEATADQLNYLVVSAGSASPSKAIVLDSSKNISGINAILASTLTGTLQTASQPNITTVGTLGALTVTNGVSASTLTGTLQTASQPNITSVGTLSSLTVTNDITAATLTGTLQTADQPNITSLGSLSSVSIDGFHIQSEAGYLSGATVGTASNSKVVVLDSSKNFTGINSLSASTLTGTLQTASQPNITSVGTLSSLTVTNGITAATLTGTLQTGAQPNITSIGSLSSITIDGYTIDSEAEYLSGVIAGSAANSKVLVLNSSGSISGITSLSANNLTGTLQTASQPNITSIGSLISITVSGSTIGSEAGFLSGAVAGTASSSKVLVLNGSGSISGINSLGATTLTGTLQTVAQTNITSVGTLSSLTVSGSVAISSSTDASSTSNGGALTVAGGLAVAKSIYVGTNLSVGGSLMIGGSPIGSEIGYLSGVVAGSASNSRVLVLSSSGSISGISSLTASSLTGTLQTASQPNITSVGTLGSLTVTNGVSASTLTGTLQTASQPNITSVGTLGSLTVTNGVSASTLTGTLQTASQPNITSVGTLGSLTVTNGVFASTLTGTLQTASQPNITSVGTLGSLTVSGAATISSITDATSSAAGGALTVSGGLAIAKSMYVGTTANISGGVIISATTDSSSGSTGSLYTAGGIGISKALHVGTNATIAGTLSVTGNTTNAGTIRITNTTDSTSVSTGSLSTAGGLGISKALFVGTNATIAGTLSVTGITTHIGAVSITSATDTTSGSTGSLYTAGGLGISKALYVGTNATIAGTLSITGTTAHTGAVSITSATDSTSGSTGSLYTAGGLGVSKALYVGMTSTLAGSVSISSSTASTSTTTGALVVSGGVGVAGNLNVAGSVALSGNTTSSGSIRAASMALVGTEPSVTNTLSTISNITGTTANSNLKFSCGMGYISSNDSIVVAGGNSSTSAFVYYTTNEGATWLSVPMTGNALSRYNSQTTWKIGDQLIVDPINGLIHFTALGYSTTTSSVCVVFYGTVTGISSSVQLFADTAGISSAGSAIAAASSTSFVATAYNAQLTASVLYHSTNGTSVTQVSYPNSITYISWIGGGVNKYIAAAYTGSTHIMVYSTTGASFTTASIPSSTTPVRGIYYNTTLGLVFGIGDNFIWYSSDGVTWTNATYTVPTVTLGAIINSPNSGLMAIYTQSGAFATPRQVYYSTNGINWTNIGVSTVPAIPLTRYNSTGYNSNTNIAYVPLNTTTLAKIGPIQPSYFYGLSASTGGYLSTTSNSGYKWLNASTTIGTGTQLAQLDSAGLALNVNESITNTTDSTSTSTGSFITSGGVGIAKTLYVGTGINGTIQTASQPNITSVGTLSSLAVTNAVTATMITLSGSSITSTEAGYLTSNTAGTAVASKALVLDGSKNISGINVLSLNNGSSRPLTIYNSGMASGSGISYVLGKSSATDQQAEITFTYSSTAGQSYLSLGHFGASAIVNIRSNGNVGVGTTTPGYLLDVFGSFNATSYNISGVSANVGALTGVTVGTAAASKALILNASTSVAGITSVGTTTLVLGGTSLGATEAGLISGITEGTASANKALVLNASTSVSGINSVGTTTLVLGGTSLGATNAGYISGITAGSTIANKALIVDSSKNIFGINSLGLGTSTDSARYLSILNSSLTAGSSLYHITYGQSASNNNQAELAFIYAGSGSASNALSFGFFGSTEILKIFADQSVDIFRHNGSSTGLKLGGVLVTATATQLNYNTVTAGTASASKALVLDSSSNIIGIVSLSATNLTGTLQTASQPNITSVGTLTSLMSSGIVTLTNTTTSNATTSGCLVLSGGLGISKNIQIGGAISAGSWTTGGIQYRSSASTFTNTNTPANGTTPFAVFSSYAQPTLAATNTGVTATTAATVYIDNAPAAGSNVSITNSYALMIANGNQLINSNSTSSAPLLTLKNTASGGLTNMKIISDSQSWEIGTRGSTQFLSGSYYIYDNNSSAFRFLISPNGHIGISNTDPLFDLDVSGSFNATSYYLNGSMANVDAITGVTAGAATANKALIVDSSSNLRGIGKLGIGTSIPSTSQLEVSTSSTTEIRLSSTSATDRYTSLYQSGLADHFFIFVNESATNKHFPYFYLGSLGSASTANIGHGGAIFTNTASTSFVTAFRAGNNGNAGVFVDVRTNQNSALAGTFSNHPYSIMTNNTARIALDTAGGCKRTGGSTSTSFDSGSDRRIKEDIVDADLDLCYSNIKKLKLKYYKWSDDYIRLNSQQDTHVLGWIAQEVEEIFPKSVTKSKEYGFDDFRTLNIDTINRTLYGCVAKLIQDKESLETKNEALETKVSDLEARLAKIEASLNNQ